ncbi:unnamed protein product [Lampetra planeri]
MRVAYVVLGTSEQSGERVAGRENSIGEDTRGKESTGEKKDVGMKSHKWGEIYQHLAKQTRSAVPFHGTLPMRRRGKQQGDLCRLQAINAQPPAGPSRPVAVTGEIPRAADSLKQAHMGDKTT